ncbi:MAG: hypothetical protein KIT10_05460 [Flavobacteriales bacterium]|nr:hypothetical protein [Flavobacteriales bacterium]
MKNWNRMMGHLLVAGSLLVGTAAFAQDTSKPMHKGKDFETRLARMTEQLSLSEDQTARMRAIHADHARRMADVRKMEDEAERQAAMKELRNAKHDAMQAVLTPEQKARKEQLKAERRAAHEKGDGQRKGHQHGGHRHKGGKPVDR